MRDPSISPSQHAAGMASRKYLYGVKLSFYASSRRIPVLRRPRNSGFYARNARRMTTHEPVGVAGRLVRETVRPLRRRSSGTENAGPLSEFDLRLGGVPAQ
jgi:hypothetical protein